MTKSRDLANAATALNAVTATELGFVDGVTSAIQTQIDTKLATATAATTYVANSLADAKGDLLTATADNTPARLAVGSNGETLVADSSTSTGLRYQGNYAAGKQKCLNSDLSIWQRGTSFTADSVYGPDRWFLSGTTNQMTFSQVTSSLPSTFQYAIKLQRNSGSTSATTFTIAQAFETSASIPLQGQVVTLSFWAKAGANLSGSALIRLYSGTGTNQSAVSQFGGWTGYAEWQNTGSFTPTSTWTRFTTTGTVPSNATQIGLRLGFVSAGTAGADDSLQITGVQLEVGSVATPFQTATGTIQGELAACQRYLPAFRNDTAAAQDLAIGYAFGTNAAIYVLPFNQSARVAPTGVTVTGTIYGTAINTTYTITPSFNSGTLYSANVTGTPTITAGQGSRIILQPSSSILFTGCEL
jgi:hypothetical protein